MSVKESGGERESRAGEQALIDVDLIGVGGRRAFLIRNLGDGAATDLNLEIEAEEGKVSPLIKSEVSEKLPVRKLRPGDEVRLSAVITTGTGIHFTATVSWLDADGSRRSERTELNA